MHNFSTNRQLTLITHCGAKIRMNLFPKPLVALRALPIVALLAASVDAKIWECGERSNLPLEGKNYCAAEDFRQTEIDLKKVLNALLKKHTMVYNDTSALTESQSAFESYRNIHCAAETKRIEDKPYHPMIVAQCKSRLTNLRINDLKRMQQQDP